MSKLIERERERERENFAAVEENDPDKETEVGYCQRNNMYCKWMSKIVERVGLLSQKVKLIERKW